MSRDKYRGGTKESSRNKKSERSKFGRYTVVNGNNRVECEIYDLEWIKYYLCPNVYKPSDDTLLLMEIVEDNIVTSQGNVLEIGSGTGIVLAYVLKNNQGLTGIGIDINPFASYNTYLTLRLNNLDHRAEALNCRSVTCIRKGTLFDIVLYNPPYLIGEPDMEDFNDIAELGGAYGINNLIEVLAELLENNNINYKTKIYVIVAEPPSFNETSKRLRDLGFNIKVRGTKYFFYEKIHGLELELLDAAKR